MGWCKKDVTPLLTHWSYVFLALTHRYVVKFVENTLVVLTGQSIGTQSLFRQQSIFQTTLVDWKGQAKYYDPKCHAFQSNTVQFHYKMSKFPPNTRNKHPIAHP